MPIAQAEHSQGQSRRPGVAAGQDTAGLVAVAVVVVVAAAGLGKRLGRMEQQR